MGQGAKRFEDLVVWQKAHRLVLGVYQITHAFPRHELYGLTSQLRRSAVSIPANIAEGFKKTGQQGKTRYWNIAQGSLEEVRYDLTLARDLGYVSDGDVLMSQLVGASKLLASYSAKVRQSQ